MHVLLANNVDLYKLERDLRAARELRENLALVVFLLFGYGLLLLLWVGFRRLFPRQQSPFLLPASAPRGGGEVTVSRGFVLWLFLGLVGLPVGWRWMVQELNRLTEVERADLVVIAHAAFLLAVVTLQLAIVVGWFARWGWVRNFWFRLLHIVGVHLVAAQAVLGLDCPLTTWEWELRYEDAEALALASPMARVASKIVFVLHGCPPWVFIVVYSAFALAVLLTWAFVPPYWPASPNAERRRDGVAE